MFSLPFPFLKKSKGEKDKTDEEAHYLKVNVPLDATKEDSVATEWKVPIFENGKPEHWIKWHIAFDSLTAAHPLKTAEQKLTMLQSLSQDEAKISLMQLVPRVPQEQ